MTKEEQIRQDCWDKSLHCLGTSYIFQFKTKIYKRWIRVITLLGIVVPLLLGGTAAAYGQNSVIIGIAIAIAAPITIFQMVLSGISLVLKWDDNLAYSLESQTDNRVISDDYVSLAKFPPPDNGELEKQYSIIKAKDDARTKQDEKVSFSIKDNRKGMRYALWIRQKECATCKKIPSSMKPTNCETCGNF